MGIFPYNRAAAIKAMTFSGGAARGIPHLELKNYNQARAGYTLAGDRDTGHDHTKNLVS